MFDTPGAKITGKVIGEDDQRVFLSWPAAISVQIQQVEDNTFQYRARFEPIAFAGEAYALYRSAIRGESYRYEPELLAAYKAFAAKAAAGGYDLRPVMEAMPEVVMQPSDTPDVAVTVGSAEIPGAAHVGAA